MPKKHIMQRQERAERKKVVFTHVVDKHVLSGSDLGVLGVGGNPELVTGVDLDVGVVGHETSSDLRTLSVKRDGKGSTGGVSCDMKKKW